MPDDDSQHGKAHNEVEVLRYAAFTDHGGGNPAGVVLDATGLDDAQRLAIAAGVGYSETSFVDEEGPEGHFRLRFFSPLGEVSFCGHATVATSVALAERRGPGRLSFDTRSGQIEVETRSEDGGYAATLTSVPTSTRAASPDELAATLAALGWVPEDLDPRYPPHVAYAGNEHLILAVRSRSRLSRLDYDYDQLAALMAERGWTTLQLVHAETPLSFSSRNPFPPGGVVEDPATGAAAAALGGYLRALQLVDLPARITILQGQDMGSPSRLVVDLTGDDDRVRVSGAASEIG
ncbi:PhzF family phenazine biosynthesis isomerase [Nocardioides salsibiostraticola]